MWAETMRMYGMDVINDYIQKIKGFVKHEEISEEIVNRISYSNGKIRLEGNTLSSFFEKDEDSFIIELTEDSLHYQSQKDSTVVEVNVNRKEDKTIVKRMKSEISTYENVFMGKKNKDYNSRNVKTITSMHIYNQNGRETFRYDTEEHDNYFVHKKTGEVILHKPDVFENYLEQEYRFREDNGNIIRRRRKEYIYPDDSDNGHIKNEDHYYIGRDVTPKDNDIPFGGYFYGFDANLYKEYKQGKCDIDKIWNHEGVKELRKSRIHTEWI